MRFPVIKIRKKARPHVCVDEDELTTATRVAMNKKTFIGLTIIDSDGKYFIVEDAEKIGTIGFFFGFNIFLNQKIRIKFVYNDSVITKSLYEVKLIILHDFKSHKELWDSYIGKQDAINLIEFSNSIESLISNYRKIEYGLI